MLLVDVRHDGDCGIKHQKRTVAFIGLRLRTTRISELRIRTERFDHAADHRRRIGPACPSTGATIEVVEVFPWVPKSRRRKASKPSARPAFSTRNNRHSCSFAVTTSDCPASPRTNTRPPGHRRRFPPRGLPRSGS